jgi:ParB family chromosome partitioning protein
LLQSGLSRLFGNGKGYKKSELVALMADYFAKVRNMVNPKPDQQKARDWLPEAMQFPAIDPDAVEASADNAEDYAEAA